MKTISDLMCLNGRIALVTGGFGHVGVAILNSLAELGADLIVVERRDKINHYVAEEIQNKWGCKVFIYSCDLENHDERKDLIGRILNEHRSLNILINNAAFIGDSALTGWNVPFEEQSIETWRRALEVNLTAPFELCQRLSSRMSESKGASIINIGSIYDHLGPNWRLYNGVEMSNPAAYGASKGGLLQITRWLSTTMAPKVRVNSISLGGIFRNQDPTFVCRYIEGVPLGRMAVEGDFSGAIVFLASDMSSYVTGHSLNVDGGWSAW